MNFLDDINVYHQFDKSDFIGRIAVLPDQCLMAWEQAKALQLPPKYADVDNIVILGMGGSSIGGELLGGIGNIEKMPQISVVRGYDLPPWINRRTLAIVSSYSGDTEETISMYKQAKERDIPIVVITKGGILEQLAIKDNIPILKITYEGEPRTALGYAFISPLALLCKLNLISDKGSDLFESVELMRTLIIDMGVSKETERNLGKNIAEFLRGKIPALYSAGFLEGVARRWKTQFNENSKVLAVVEMLPELNHNAVEGYSYPDGIAQNMGVILLNSNLFSEELSSRYEITRSLLKDRDIPHRYVDCPGKSPLAQIMSSIVIGEHASFYLAILNQIDPAQTLVIDQVKKHIRSI